MDTCPAAFRMHFPCVEGAADEKVCTGEWFGTDVKKDGDIVPCAYAVREFGVDTGPRMGPTHPKWYPPPKIVVELLNPSLHPPPTPRR